MKTNWLDRRISAPAPYFCLCLSEKEYRKALKHLKMGVVDEWVLNAHSDATTHTMQSEEGLACVVCLRGYEDLKDLEIYGLLVHEAVHIWQEWCTHIGEWSPGREQEAYAIQALSQELMCEFQQRKGD